MIETSVMILVTTIVCIGGIVGLVSFRNELIQEFGDAAVALESVDQSYSYTFNGEDFEYQDPGPGLEDPDGSEPACLSVQVDASGE